MLSVHSLKCSYIYIYFLVTTLRPYLGTISQGQGELLTIADLPGLVEGAHQNVGMGHKFLQHIERTRVLLYVVDINGFQLSGRHVPRTPYETTELLVDELEMYSPGLAYQRKAVLVVNKMDTPQTLQHFETLLQQIKAQSPLDFHCIVGCSALNKTGMETIKNILFEIFANIKESL